VNLKACSISPLVLINDIKKYLSIIFLYQRLKMSAFGRKLTFKKDEQANEENIDETGE
jgi:hypothetical protein